MIMNVVLRLKPQSISQRKIRLYAPFIFGVKAGVKPANAHVRRTQRQHELRWAVLGMVILA